MDIMDRINLMKECSLVDDAAYADLVSIVKVFREDFRFDLTEENGGVMITHIGAAIKRLKAGEKVNPLDREVLSQAAEESVYPTAQKILDRIREKIARRLPSAEEEFLLVHICNTLETNPNGSN
ncbi:hypothetical protein CAFE_27560 [Caprobacter fermentans]|uniref:PRD domain-containing protein n=1 Tax=Caproicibacter fermentans TaxID=2576756 RepID=A0A6N8I2P1_9FIRM|nr:PRD domain-containing protein [Caproicibacter fermentans]MVB12027.1 hypothetical protein [Caproicibacter fermentans]OCN03037.1 hypothetical protein A7X67_03865 [Clostridium sp. W14A]QNK40625.1 PRD domain-containing protein [Caproicibacter fermentans]